MCLYSYSNHPKIAQEDIICYKIVLKSGSPGIFETPYQHHKCKIGDTIFSKKPLKNLKTLLNFTIIDIEGVHAYSSIHRAMLNVENMLNGVLVVCTIPKGTKYITGLETEIASEKLIINYVLN